MKIQHIPLDALKPDKNNPNVMTKKQREQLKASIERYGLVQPLVVDHKHQIINGHQKWLVIKQYDDLAAKHRKIPCYVCPPDMSAEDKMLLQQALNKVHGAHSLVKDSAIFEKLLKRDRTTDLEAILGRKEQSILNMINKGKKAAAPPAKPATTETRCKLGDVWQLGKHLIVCGDNQAPESWANLPRADITFTSPPYNVGGSGTRPAGLMTSKDRSHDVPLYGATDNKSDRIENYTQWLATLTKHALECTKYAFMNIQQTANNRQDWITYLYEHRKHFVDKIVWDKKNAVPIGAGVLRNSHEDILVFASQENPNRKIDTLADGATFNCIQITTDSTHPDQEFHSATFPLELAKWIISHFTPAHGTVCDPCMGTGTTMMAAELTGRTCYGIELEPAYVDNCIARWEKHTKCKAEKVKSA